MAMTRTLFVLPYVRMSVWEDRCPRTLAHITLRTRTHRNKWPFQRQMFEYLTSNRFAQPGKSKPGSLDICSNPNRAIEGQIFEMAVFLYGGITGTKTEFSERELTWLSASLKNTEWFF